MKLESNSITFFTLFLKGNRTSSCLLVCLKIESALILFFLLTWINAKEYIENRNNFLWFFSHAALVKEVKVYTIVNKHKAQKMRIRHLCKYACQDFSTLQVLLCLYDFKQTSNIWYIYLFMPFMCLCYFLQTFKAGKEKCGLMRKMKSYNSFPFMLFLAIFR